MKKRIDVILVEMGLAKSREKAKAQVIAGNVFVDGKKIDSPSSQFDEGADVQIRGNDCPYVSRGGLKLEKALKEFGIGLGGAVCLDIGASTGGFTDCMLKNGAAFVYAVDVGYGQFDWGLRNDGRVALLERTNARYLEPFEREIEFACVDVSFISLTLIFPAIRNVCGDGQVRIVTLIKPQFEAGREKVGKKGVVKDGAVHEEVIRRVRGAAEENGYTMRALTYSPVKGPNGNIEYLAYFTNVDEKNPVSDELVAQVVENAQNSL